MDQAEIKIVEQRRVYQNQYGELFDDKVQFQPQGFHGTYVRWRWRAPYAVAVLPLLSSNEFVLIESFRHAARHTVLEVPKGFGEAEVDPAEVALRELREEAGLSSSKLTSLGMVITDPGFSHFPFHLFVAHGCKPAVSEPETSEVIVDKPQYKVSDIPRLLRSGILVDAITVILLQHLLLLEAHHDETDRETVPERSRYTP